MFDGDAAVSLSWLEEPKLNRLQSEGWLEKQEGEQG